MRSDASLFGLFKNVILTQEDYEELSRTIVEDLDGLIDRLSAYMTSTGKTVFVNLKVVHRGCGHNPGLKFEYLNFYGN